jgi:AraC-like DNA-binding protein
MSYYLRANAQLGLWLADLVEATLAGTQGFDRDWLAVCLRQAKNRLHLPFSVTAWGKAMGMSRTAFIERFQAEAGETPGRCLRRLRQEHASLLLRNSSSTVKRVAAQCGYRSEAAFIRSFIHAFGCSPSQWRNLPYPTAPAQPTLPGPRNGPGKKP